jgi:hypothetical protein
LHSVGSGEGEQLPNGAAEGVANKGGRSYSQVVHQRNDVVNDIFHAVPRTVHLRGPSHVSAFMSHHTVSRVNERNAQTIWPIAHIVSYAEDGHHNRL